MASSVTSFHARERAACVLDEAWYGLRRGVCIYMKATSTEQSDVSMELISISDMEMGHRE